LGDLLLISVKLSIEGCVARAFPQIGFAQT
jgi:hypothetical protein